MIWRKNETQFTGNVTLSMICILYPCLNVSFSMVGLFVATCTEHVCSGLGHQFFQRVPHVNVTGTFLHGHSIIESMLTMETNEVWAVKIQMVHISF